MVNFDFECLYGHRFEGTFSDYEAFVDQHDKKMIRCPLCDTDTVKRIFTGCSIQSKGRRTEENNSKAVDILKQLDDLNRYVKENFDNVGDDFADAARAIHYGIEKERNIYGTTGPDELKELVDEGIPVFPVPKNNKPEN